MEKTGELGKAYPISTENSENFPQIQNFMEFSFHNQKFRGFFIQDFSPKNFSFLHTLFHRKKNIRKNIFQKINY
jgi:hypothetical protein